MAIGGLLFVLPKRIGAPPMALETLHEPEPETEPEHDQELVEA
jgi:hypothetical protein